MRSGSVPGGRRQGVETAFEGCLRPGEAAAPDHRVGDVGRRRVAGDADVVARLPHGAHGNEGCAQVEIEALAHEGDAGRQHRGGDPLLARREQEARPVAAEDERDLRVRQGVAHRRDGGRRGVVHRAVAPGLDRPGRADDVAEPDRPRGRDRAELSLVEDVVELREVGKLCVVERDILGRPREHRT